MRELVVCGVVARLTKVAVPADVAPTVLVFLPQVGLIVRKGDRDGDTCFHWMIREYDLQETKMSEV